MRKQLLALLSVLGLAGSSTPTSAQVLKGSEPGDKTKSESTVKRSKTAQEAGEVKKTQKIKFRKAGGEQNATTDVVNEKHRKTGLKGESALGDGSVKPKTSAHSTGGGGGAGKVKTEDVYMKDKKSAAETKAHANEHIKKATNASEAQAAQKEASEKPLEKRSEPKKQ